MRCFLSLYPCFAIVALTLTACVPVRQNGSKSSASVNELLQQSSLRHDSYKFSGRITDTNGKMCYGRLELLGASDLIKGVTGDFETGAYEFMLASESLLRASQIRVTAWGYDTLIQKFELSWLLDSVIKNDYNLTIIESDTVIIRSYPSHRLFPKDSVNRNQH